jgi:dTDP-4-dehydrorhamnose reductase
MIKKSPIFLTGGSGLLALNWFYTKKNDYSVYLGLNERTISLKDANLIFIDFQTVDSFKNQLKNIQPSFVIHTAGLTSVEKCEENPDLAYQINVDLSKLVALVTKELNIPLVHISTDHLFNGSSSMLLEDVPTCPLNFYGETKALAEKLILQINPNALIIRTNFYAWGTTYRKSFSDFIIESLRKKEVISLFDDVYYTPILAEKLIETVHELLQKKEKGIFNIVSDDKISKFNFGILIAEEFGLDKSLIHRSNLKDNPNLVRRPADMSLSNKKVKDLLGRNLGTVKQHIAKLHQQETEYLIHQIQLL